MRTLALIAILLPAAVPAFAQKLSPREVFYGQTRANSAAKPAPSASPAPAKKKPAAAPARKQNVDAEPASPAAIAPEPVRVELAGNKMTPLGIRYSVKRLEASGDYTEVDSETQFREGDRICLLIETNDTGFLYVIHQGSSGRWEPMYPADRSTSGSNQVERGRVYRVPADPDQVFTFDSKPGTEKLFVILTRQPEQDLEQLIYSLQDRKPAPGEQPKVMMAQSIQDELVQRLRNAYSRDLVIEKVDDSRTPPAPARSKVVPPERMGEKAVYVLNPKAGPAARVVADVQLRHR